MVEVEYTAPSYYKPVKAPGSKVKKAGFKRRGKKVCRNELCPCGSGIKFKRCCKSEEVLINKAITLFGEENNMQ